MHFFKKSKCIIFSRYPNALLQGIKRFVSLSHTQKLWNLSVCVISLSSVKNLVCSNYFCHLLPTVANYCTNSLQRLHSQTHTFTNTYTVRRSIHKYHVTGQWVPSPEVREAADLPLGWTPPETDKSATDCSWHNLYGNLTGHTEPVLLGAATTAHQGWQVCCEREVR